jgi:hypothetical protein
LPLWLHFLCWLLSVVGSLLCRSSRIGADGRSPLRLSFLSVCCMCLGHFLCGFVSGALCKLFLRHPFFLIKRHVKSCSRKKRTCNILRAREMGHGRAPSSRHATCVTDSCATGDCLCVGFIEPGTWRLSSCQLAMRSTSTPAFSVTITHQCEG